MNFPSTDLPKLEGDKDRDTESIRKSVLELLDKINKTSDRIDALTSSLSKFPTTYQSGVFKSGTNYIQYADGTMVQWGTTTSITMASNVGVALIYVGSVSVTYPIPFVGIAPSVETSATPGTAVNVFPSSVTASTITGVTVAVGGFVPDGTKTAFINWQATGKWK